MKLKSLNLSAALLSCVGMLISPVAMAATPLAAPRDVALQDGGVLLGQVVDAQGVLVAMSPVSLYSGGKEIARTQSDHTGRFTVSGLKGGVYQVASVNNQGVYRLWSPRTAPPAAQRGLMLVSSSDVARGQFGLGGPFGGLTSWISQHPIMTASAIAAAIAIPIALDEDDPVPATP